MQIYWKYQIHRDASDPGTEVNNVSQLHFSIN